MIETLARLQAGTLPPIAQDHAAATLAPILRREDALVDFARPATELYNRWRGFQPWPGAYTFFRGKKLTLHRVKPGGSSHLPPGELTTEQNRLFVAAGLHTRLELLEIQLEGKKKLASAEFLRGTTPLPHETVGLSKT